MDPSSIVDESLTPGNTVVITANVGDAQNLFAFEFKIYFNNTVLNATKAIRPTGHFLEPADPGNQFVPKWEIKNNYNATHGRLWLSFTMLFPETARSGNGILAEITFTVLNIGFTTMEFSETLLVDDTGNMVAHDIVNGYFSNTLAPPPPEPSKPARVYVDPPDITDPMLIPSSNFTIHVSIVNATDVYSFEFRLDFNPAILEALGLQDGSFLQNDNVTFTIMTINNTEGYVSMNSTLTDLPAVSGDGNFAVLSFNVLKTGSTPLTISELILRNSTGQPLNVTFSNGHFSNVAQEGDVNQDGIVDILDINVAALAFGATPDNPRWNPAADLNSDGIINVFDLVIILINFGSVIPEYPSHILLLPLIMALVLVTAVFRRKRLINFKT